MDKSEYDLWWSIGVTASSEENYAKAEMAFQMALSIDKTNKKAWLFLAHSLENQGKQEEAENVLKDADAFFEDK